MSAANPGATLVAPVHTIDPVALAAYLRKHVAPFSGDLAVEQFRGGQSNPTYRINAGGRRYVLRRKPPGQLLPSAHAIEREFRVMSALAGSDVPVPKMFALCEDASVLGTARNRVGAAGGVDGFVREERTATDFDMGGLQGGAGRD